MDAVLVSRDLLFSSKIVAAAEQQGWRVEQVVAESAAADAAAGTKLVIVDLTSVRSADALAEIVEAWHKAGVPVVAFAPHVHVGLIEMAKAAGCDEVLTRGQFHRGAEAIFRKYASESP